MTERETVKIISLISMSYPASEKFKDDKTIKAMSEIWKVMFRDDDAHLVELAVQKHIALNKWPPSIAEIREQMVTLSHPEIIPPDIAWGAVSDALGTRGMTSYGPKLPETVKRCVEIIGLENLKEMQRGQYGGVKPGTARTVFMQQYTPMYEREKQAAMLPEPIARAERELRELNGGETLKLLDAAHEERMREDDNIRKWEERARTGIIGKPRKRKAEKNEQQS